MISKYTQSERVLYAGLGHQVLFKTRIKGPKEIKFSARLDYISVTVAQQIPRTGKDFFFSSLSNI